MIVIDAKRNAVTCIGRLGENEARVIRINVSPVIRAFPGAAFTVLHRRPGDADAYPVNSSYVTMDGENVMWTVQSGDLAKEGAGQFEVRASVGDTVVKTLIYNSRINHALDGSGNPPEPWESWVDDVEDAADRAEAAAELLENPGAQAETLEPGSSATASYSNGTFTFGIPAGAQGDPGDPGEPGQDGVSPVITVADITGGHRVTVTDAEGSHVFDVMNGEDGDPGAPGQDGVSPTVTVTNITGGHRLTITDKNGTQTVDVMDGQQGEPGDPTELIDDTAGEGVTNRTWSASKLKNEIDGIEDQIAPTESSTTATAAHAVGELFLLNGSLLVALSAIAVGDTITTTGATPNAAVTTLASKLIKDVQVNGASILNNGVADVPIATDSVLGVGIFNGNDYGVSILSNGKVYINKATTAQRKAGTGSYRPVCPIDQHESVFYGLAKAASDTSQSSSSNAVGVYTEDAKSKISDMLNAPVSVSGSTPSITAKSGVRYICGECSTLTITAPASGCIDVVFESGSTATVLTVTSAKSGVTAIKWYGGFDPSSLDANTTYEISILDGELGAALSWT